MSEPVNPPPSDDGVRVGHAEREEVVALLSESMSGGYLTLEEFDQRVTSAQAAADRGALRALLADLPVAARLSFARPEHPAAAPSGALAAHAGDWASETVLDAPMTTVTRRGVWRVARRLVLTGSMGTFKIDFGEAEVPPQGVEIDVQASMATVRLYLARNMRIVADDFAVNWWTTLKDKAGAPEGPATVPVVVRGRPHGTTVVVRRSKLG